MDEQEEEVRLAKGQRKGRVGEPSQGFGAGEKMHEMFWKNPREGCYGGREEEKGKARSQGSTKVLCRKSVSGWWKGGIRCGRR